ncbi:MAG TPA: hypothetical protein VMR90_07670 [Candidatus Cybelea sp.]|nr:hypothetical protein [Candidatus Cybelea sp.]
MAKSSSASAGSPSSKSLLFMMIAMTCGFCVLLGGGMLMASRVINVLGLRASSDKKTVRTPLGEFRFEKANEVGPGLPVYPGASLVLSGAAAGNVPAGDEQPQVISSTYHTNSAREYVATWYVEHLSAEFRRQDAGSKNLPEALRDSHISDDDIAFVGERGQQVRVVALTIDQTGTKITLLRSSAQPPARAAAAPAAPATP